MALTNKLTAIAEAIRTKTGESALLTLDEMPVAITNIETGSGGGDLPEEAYDFSGDISYLNQNGNWDWFFNTYGDKIITTNIKNMLKSFCASKLERIPFTINVSGAYNFGFAFSSMDSLIECPKIRGTFMLTKDLTFDAMLLNCTKVRDFEDLFTADMLEGFNTIKVTSSYAAPEACNFQNCNSLRSIPSWWYKFKLCEDSTAFPTYNYCMYYNLFTLCYVLDEILNIPVWRCQAAQTSNMFSSTFKSNYRLKDFTFETDNGQPIVTQWKGQTIDLTSVGWSADSRVTNYNGGITTDTQVTDDASYQALKDNPDWWTTNVAYSRYNHDSAVNTINSLPDTSAYLTSAGGTNTIKFKKASGSSTDGGAIENLTAEEIAVAAAKGWTVTLS